MIYMKYSMIFLKLLRFRSWQVLMWAMMEPNLCVPLGIRATLDTGTARLAFMESLFS
ncbi:MAG: hypothetical protein R2860_08240 [Desulfobacterales bacterium]